MGATGWSYFVPYEADVSAALQRLRKDVFARGDYVYGNDITDEQVKDVLQRLREKAEKLPEPMRTVYLQTAEKFQGEITSGSVAPGKPKRKPKTIEEVVDFQAESGTHSILDIVGISSKPEFGHITPFPREMLIEVFGSETPNRAQIEEVHSFGSLDDAADRWEGIYIIAYSGGSPSEIFFSGNSGD